MNEVSIDHGVVLRRGPLIDWLLPILAARGTTLDHAQAAAMDRLMQNRTTFMIAHRLSTLERCNVRLVLEAGRIISPVPGDLVIA